MPALNRIGKDAIVNHHNQVPFRLLKLIDKLSVGDHSGNVLVPGDNLEALKALLSYCAGNGGWVCNDNLKSPEMNVSLGKEVVEPSHRASNLPIHATYER